MATTTAVIQVSGLCRAKIAALRRQARTLGVSAEVYARQLIEEGISIERQARTRTFDELFANVQARFHKNGMSEDDLDQLVKGARSRSLHRTSRKKG